MNRRRSASELVHLRCLVNERFGEDFLVVAAGAEAGAFLLTGLGASSTVARARAAAGSGVAATAALSALAVEIVRTRGAEGARAAVFVVARASARAARGAVAFWGAIVLAVAAGLAAVAARASIGTHLARGATFPGETREALRSRDAHSAGCVAFLTAFAGSARASGKHGAAAVTALFARALGIAAGFASDGGIRFCCAARNVTGAELALNAAGFAW